MSDSKLTGYNGKVIFSHLDKAWQELMEILIRIQENQDNEALVNELATRAMRIVHDESKITDLLKTAIEGHHSNGHVQEAVKLILEGRVRLLQHQNETAKSGNGNYKQ